MLTAGGASLLIFGTLSTVAFPGFAELGIIAAGGVLLILVSTWIVQPAIYALIPPKIKAMTNTTPEVSPSQLNVPRSLALIIVLLAGSAAVLGIRSGLEMGFDYDVLALLPRDSKAAEYQRKMVTETDYQSEIVIFTARTLETGT